MTTLHIPVLVEPTIQFLINRPTGIYVDCTLGTGGHFQTIAQHLDNDAYLIGIDADPSAVQYCAQNISISQPHQFITANFADLKRVCYRAGFPKVDGILMDLGLSSFALDNPERGFTFSQNGPLDMRFSPDTAQNAMEFINTASQKELASVFKEYGEERFSQKIARRIITERAKDPIKTTGQLAAIIREEVPGQFQVKTLSRIFQAIRIHINRELDALRQGLSDAISLLAPSGRIVVISYHSIEDRIVKQFFQNEARDCICPPEFPICQCNHHAQLKILTNRPIVPNKSEIQRNSRARSARLRAAEKL
ncbi:MAG TPA: 16S rRNA (cytosine(1402)-N(4))-methyltransferase RsmH [Candidatus Marinimicrobia bacterium]|nr:16S rRNA (cytosine(1402)-N(4))-methyltransferase RsmH [Candidatus Neomarinimicrobiota bacterium]HRS51691.1 16S rRNA (cytosine(1402)-N(4))-methyltransferase RsmH [Candidatus Neomarinimicrobiota bacterium]HRU92159.1 16S rRNA (cytosine(1402)-N(4))-methyltransferase RsmH [Candidatus Neomarinimicrobiota bacterium]